MRRASASFVRPSSSPRAPPNPPCEQTRRRVRGCRRHCRRTSGRSWDASYRITDANFTALKAAGYGEDEIFELTVAAALGASLRHLDAGMRAVREED
jgi:hypothetical protein